MPYYYLIKPKIGDVLIVNVAIADQDRRLRRHNFSFNRVLHSGTVALFFFGATFRMTTL